MKIKVTKNLGKTDQTEMRIETSSGVVTKTLVLFATMFVAQAVIREFEKRSLRD